MMMMLMMMIWKMVMVMMMIDTNLGIYHVASEKPASSWGEGSVTLRSFPRLIQPDPTHPTPPSPVVWGLSTQTDTDTDTDTLISSSRHTTLPLRPGAPHHLLSQEVWDSNKKLVWGWLWNDGGSTGASTVKESTESAETIRLLQNVCHSLITPHVVAIRRPFQLFLTFFSFLGSPSPPTVHFPSHVACSFLSNTIP